MTIAAAIALLLRQLPTLIQWGDDLHAAWVKWRTNVAARAVQERADAAQARYDANQRAIADAFRDDDAAKLAAAKAASAKVLADVERNPQPMPPSP